MSTTQIDQRDPSRPFALKPGSETARLYRVPEAMALLSLSRSVLYEQIRAGRLKSVTQGCTRLIPHSAIADYVALLLHEAR
jgi:excisionase family DNA binding protein